MELTILMPCLNEALTVEACVRKARAFMEMRSLEGEVLVVDNGSTDGSLALAHAAGARVIQYRTRDTVPRLSVESKRPRAASSLWETQMIPTTSLTWMDFWSGCARAMISWSGTALQVPSSPVRCRF